MGQNFHTLFILADVSDIFNFFLPGEWRGESGATGRGGVWFFIESPSKGGVSPRGEGASGPGGCLQGIGGGGGLNIFFGGLKRLPSYLFWK